MSFLVTQVANFFFFFFYLKFIQDIPSRRMLSFFFPYFLRRCRLRRNAENFIGKFYESSSIFPISANPLPSSLAIAKCTSTSAPPLPPLAHSLRSDTNRYRIFHRSVGNALSYVLSGRTVGGKKKRKKRNA